MPSPNQVNSFLKLYTDNLNGNGYLELEGVNYSGNTSNALFINNNCGRNTNINVGSGSIFLGSFVNMQKHLEIGDPTNGITSPSNNIALDIHTHAGTGIRFKTNTDAMELITVENNSNSNFKKTFTVLGDGKTEISTENADALVVKNLNYSNNISFNVKSDGSTGIFTYMSKAFSITSQNTGVENFSFNTNGTAQIKTTATNLTDNVLTITSVNNSNLNSFLIKRNGVMEIRTLAANAGDNVFSIMDANNSNAKNFFINRDGKTVIGSLGQPSGTHSNAMLTVNGKAVAKEVIVTQVNWADFVFDSNYKLMPLSDLESFYKNEKHLPNIPSTKQISDSGNDLGKTDALLLQKIEELTLYIVDQQKQIDELKKVTNK